MIQGLSERITSGGVCVVRWHYSADEKKRPGTTLGDAWIEHASQGYIGGTASPRWRKEMEIDYGALGGMKLFPDWERWLGLGRIVIPFFEPEGYRLYGSYDHGWRNPASFHVHGVDYDGNKVTLWEFYDSHVALPYVARIIKGETVVVPSPGCGCHPRPRTFDGNPFGGRLTWSVADPQIWAEDQPLSDNTMKSIAYLFSREGVHFTRGEKGGDTMFAEWLHGYYWKDPANPLWRITSSCPKLIWEIGMLRHQDVSARVALHRDQPEKLVEKDDHAWDDTKYFAQRFPPKHQPKKPEQVPNTFKWWRESTRRQKRGERLGTFRV